MPSTPIRFLERLCQGKTPALARPCSAVEDERPGFQDSWGPTAVLSGTSVEWSGFQDRPLVSGPFKAIRLSRVVFCG